MNLLKKHFMIVGGTDGIGKATALKLASKGANVTIVGRSQEKANDSLSKLQEIQLDQSQSFTFKKLDVTNISQVADFCNNVSAIDGVLLCAGGLNYGPRRTTDEGLEMTFAMNYFSRFVFMKLLGPKLRGNPIINCLSAGNGFGVNTEDFQLEQPSWFPFYMRAIVQCASLGDVIAQEFATRYPNDAQYFHYFPGTVATDAAKNNNFPYVLVMLNNLVKDYISSKPESVADVLVTILTSKEYADKKMNGSLLDPKGKQLAYKQKDPKQVGQKVWDYSNSLYEKLVNKT
jgi:NAD(P)-dependent dehydrogenase (short-subunit alcohol dehydrogenase family)